MSLRRIKLLPLLKETVSKWNADNCIRLGASLSYYTLFSLFPLILVVLTIVRLLLVNSDAARDAILNALSSVTGGFRDDFLAALEAAIRTRRASGIVGTLTLLLGASWVFGELVSAFNIMWRVEAPSGGGPLEFMRATLFSFALVLSGAFLLLVSMIFSAVLAALGSYLDTLPGGVVMWRVVQTLFNLGVLTGLFALLFKYLPRTYVAWRDVWLGAFLTALLWAVLQSVIAFYISFSNYADYGAIGAILALVAWVYLSSQVVFIGGEFTTVYAKHYGSRAQAAPPVRPYPQLVSAATPGGTPAGRQHPSTQARVVSSAAGITVGVLGTLSFATIALLVGLGRTLRRLFSR